MKASAGASRPAFVRDARGNLQIIEVMIVGVMVMGAVVAVSTMDKPPSKERESPLDEDAMESYLVASVTSPGDNTSGIRYGDYLTQMSIEALTGQNENLKMELMTHWLGIGAQLNFQYGNSPIVMYGPTQAPWGPNSHAQVKVKPDWGTTLIRPGMSHYNPNQAIDLDVLPLDAGGPLPEADIPYTVTARLVDEDRAYTQSSHGELRIQNKYRIPLVNVSFEAADGSKVNEAGLDELIPRGTPPTEHVWQVRINLTSDQAHSSEVWWDHTHALRIEPPAGWSYDAAQPHDWDRLPAHEGGDTDAIIRLKYTGERQVGPGGGVELTVNLTRSALSDTGQSQVVAVWTEGERVANNHLVLRSIAATRELPFGVYASTSQPWSASDWSPFRVLVTNPRSETYTLEQVEVLFANSSYEFTSMDASLPEGWERHRLDHDRTAFYWNESQSLPGGASRVLEFPAKATKLLDRGGFHVFQSPVAKALDAGGNVVSAVVASPIGPGGHYQVVLPPMTGLGEHTVVVPDNYLGAPPGRGNYTVKQDLAGLLDEVQTARYTMGLEATPAIHGPDESVVLSVETGSLLGTLRALDGVDADSVRVNVTATDMWGWVTEDYYAVDEFALSLDSGSQVRGIDYIDANGVGAIDVWVTYEDGHVAALDGDDPRNLRLWKEELETRVTSAPVVMDVTGDGRDELVVVGSKQGVHELIVVDFSGEVVQRVELEGYPSHLVRSECRPGVWFQASMVTDPNLKTPLDGDGFLSGSPLWSQLGYWEPGGSDVYAEQHMNANPFAVREGSFAPFGRCSVVQAMGDDSAADPTLHLVRVDAFDMSKMWEFQGAGLIRGFGVEDVVTTPIEAPNARVPVPARSDEIVLVTDEFGLEVLSGWAGYARPGEAFLPALLPEDELLGLSWVDHDVGYVASKAGYLWRTTDAGATWTQVQLTPIVTGGFTLHEFVFGGTGKGLFERSDGWVASFDGTDVSEFEAPAVQNMAYKGLAFTENRPGIIGYDGVDQVTAVFEWDGPNTTVVGDPINPIPCECHSTIGHDAALVGIQGGTIYVATPTVSRQIALAADAAVAHPNGAILAYDGTSFIYNTTTTQEQFQDLDVPSVARRAAPYRGGAEMVAGSLHYALNGDGVVKQNITTDDLVGTSSGNGARWFVSESGLIRDQVPTSHWFAIDPGADVVNGASVTVTNPNSPGTPSIIYEVHVPNGTKYTIPPGQSLAISWESGSLLQYTVRGTANAPPTGPGASLRIEGDFAERTLDAARDSDCTECLAPIGSPSAIHHAEGVWADSDGILAQSRLPDIGPDPVLVGRVSAAPLLASGSLDAGLHSYAVDTGFTADSDITGFLGAPASIKLGVAARPSLDDVLWAELSMEPVGVGGLSGILPGQGRAADVSPKLARLDPGTGALTCVADWPDTDRIGGRVLATHPLDPEAFYSGTGLGKVGLMHSDACTAEWEQTVAETGSRILLTVPPSERDWLGPRIYLVDIVVDIAPLDEVRVQLMAFSVRNDRDAPRAEFEYEANLLLWL